MTPLHNLRVLGYLFTCGGSWGTLAGAGAGWTWLGPPDGGRSWRDRFSMYDEGGLAIGVVRGPFLGRKEEFM